METRRYDEKFMNLNWPSPMLVGDCSAMMQRGALACAGTYLGTPGAHFVARLPASI